MPEDITQDDGLDLEELRKAIQRDAFGELGEEQEELEPGPDLRVQDEEEEPVEAAEPEPEVEPEVEAEPEPEAPKQKVLTEEELENLIVKAKVNGKEVEYTWKQLRDIKQTQDAAQEFLERAKAEFKAEREAYREQFKTQPQPQADEEYLTDEEKRVRALEQELEAIRQNQRSLEETTLSEAEERHMRSMFEREGLSEEQAANRLKQIVDTYPDAAEFARDLFTKSPSNRDDLNKRIKTFNTIWQLGKTIELPEVVRRTAEMARAEGKTEAKVEAKRQLADTSAGSSEIREPSKAEKLRKLSKNADAGFVDFMLENSAVIKSFE
jgi:hypothetical protein